MRTSLAIQSFTATAAVLQINWRKQKHGTLQRKSGLATWSALANLTNAQSTYTDGGLAQATSYSYRIMFSNSNYSNTVTVTTAAAPVTQLAAPTNLVFAAVAPAPTDTTAMVQLQWASQSASNESGFGIERAPASGVFAQVGTTAKNVNSFRDTGLAFATAYQYRVRAL